MIEKKKKECKGNHTTDNFTGCGGFFYDMKFGLCKACLYDWTKRTEKGRFWFENQIKFTKQKFNTEKKINDKNKRFELTSKMTFWTKEVQPIFNEIARLIDYQNACIATNVTQSQMHGGHYFSVGSNKSASLNLHNIHIQSAYSNHYSSDDKRYRDGLINRYGVLYFEFIETFRAMPELIISKDELKEIKEKASKIRNELKKELRYRNETERIEIRNKINQQLNLYTSDYGTFKNN
jgi:hypothetical protein